MPQYSFKCNNCGYEFDLFLCSTQRNQTQKCPMCLHGADRSLISELRSTRFNSQETIHERWSWSMGVATPEEGREKKQEHPDYVYKFGDYGPLLVNSRKDKLKKMSEHGMQEY